MKRFFRFPSYKTLKTRAWTSALLALSLVLLSRGTTTAQPAASNASATNLPGVGEVVELDAGREYVLVRMEGAKPESEYLVQRDGHALDVKLQISTVMKRGNQTFVLMLVHPPENKRLILTGDTVRDKTTAPLPRQAALPAPAAPVGAPAAPPASPPSSPPASSLFPQSGVPAGTAGSAFGTAPQGAFPSGPAAAVAPPPAAAGFPPASSSSPFGAGTSPFQPPPGAGAGAGTLPPAASTSPFGSSANPFPPAPGQSQQPEPTQAFPQGPASASPFTSTPPGGSAAPGSPFGVGVNPAAPAAPGAFPPAQPAQPGAPPQTSPFAGAQSPFASPLQPGASPMTASPTPLSTPPAGAAQNPFAPVQP